MPAMLEVAVKATRWSTSLSVQTWLLLWLLPCHYDHSMPDIPLEVSVKVTRLTRVSGADLATIIAISMPLIQLEMAVCGSENYLLVDESLGLQTWPWQPLWLLPCYLFC